jgi:hypothetical protein
VALTLPSTLAVIQMAQIPIATNIALLLKMTHFNLTSPVTTVGLTPIFKPNRSDSPPRGIKT